VFGFIDSVLGGFNGKNNLGDLWCGKLSRNCSKVEWQRISTDEVPIRGHATLYFSQFGKDFILSSGGRGTKDILPTLRLWENGM